VPAVATRVREHHVGQGRRVVKAFQDELDQMCSDVLRFSAVVRDSVAIGTQAFLDQDLTRLATVVGNDAACDELMHRIELHAYELLARHQPVAGDLRTVLAVLRILHELELSSDLMVSVVKSARRLYGTELPVAVSAIVGRMGAQAALQLQLAATAFAQRDESMAAALPDLDDVMDDLQRELFRAVFDSCGSDPTRLPLAVEIALVGRFYERVADHSVQIGRWLTFLVTGALPGLALSSLVEELRSE
jgi:phosphate transport system protein